MIKRFTEIVSTQKVIDNLTGNEYHCLIDDDLLELLNKLDEENQRLKKENKSLIDGIKNTARQGADFTVKVWQSKDEVKTINGGYYD